MHPEPSALTILAGLWGAYCLLHSLLASLAIKEWIASRWPNLVPAYRLAYNLLATLLILPPLWMTFTLQGPWLWSWRGPWMWLANGLAGAAAVGFVWSLRHYDGQEFLGLRQLARRERSVLDQERFQLSPMHRYVRHPWYTLGLVILWTRDMNAAWLLTATLLTAYLVLGSRLEERKLLRYHGEVYARYRARVPGLVPLPWRYLSATEARRLAEG